MLVDNYRAYTKHDIFHDRIIRKAGAWFMFWSFLRFKSVNSFKYIFV